MQTQEPWHLKDFVGTHQICASSVDPDSEPVALLCMADYSRSIECVNAFTGVPDPEAFMEILEELMTAIESVPEFNLSNYHHDDVADCERAKADMFDVWNRLRAARGPKGVGK